MEDSCLLDMDDMVKSFSGVTVLHEVGLHVKKGEVHALVGENGAGKSTLMKILAGLFKKDSGTIKISGKEVNVNNPDDARDLGISFIHQEICLVPSMTIAENIFLARELKKGPFRFVDFQEMNKKAQDMMDEMHMDLKSDVMVEKLSIAQQQMVEITRALSSNARLIIMDEPTSSLADSEVNGLYKRIRQLREKGISVIYISHRLVEIFEVADRVTVLRDGNYIGTRETKDITEEEIIKMMVGREVTNIFIDKKPPVGGEDYFEVRGLTNNKIQNISFTLKKGEILGFSGLIGAGRTEMARAIFGIDHIKSGEIFIEGKKINIKTPPDAIGAGIALVPEDRKKHGLVLMHGVRYNITLTVLRNFIKIIKVNRKIEANIVTEYATKLNIKMTGYEQLCSDLSGGNQQKVVLAKWLAMKPSLIILDEPTRGIDVGAKYEIYRLIYDLASSGIPVIFISSELHEIINLSSRIAVMREGRIAAIIDANETNVTQEQIMHYATGGK